VLRRLPQAAVLTSSRDASSFRQRLASSSARGLIAKRDLTGTALAALADDEPTA
jgi:hypothetical protein